MWNEKTMGPQTCEIHKLTILVLSFESLGKNDYLNVPLIGSYKIYYKKDNGVFS
jgi:hypothetical protein